MLDQESPFPTTICAVDVESNGNTVPEIIELSLVCIEPGTIKWPRVTWTIKPVRPINPVATKIHGITNEYVAHAPELPSIRNDILSSLKRGPIVAHNAHVDYRLLKLSFPDWEPPAVYDTLRLARFVVPGLPSYNLATLVTQLGITAYLRDQSLTQPHRASYDAAAAACLFVLLAKRARENGLTTEHVLRLSKMKTELGSPSQGSLF